MFPFSWKYKYLVHFIKCKEIRSSVNKGSWFLGKIFKCTCWGSSSWLLLLPHPVPLFQQKLPSIIVNLLQFWSVALPPLVLFPVNHGAAFLSVALPLSHRKCFVKITLVMKLNFSRSHLKKNHQFEHLIKICGKIILESQGFSSYIVWLAEITAGKRADLACMEIPSGKPDPCNPT